MADVQRSEENHKGAFFLEDAGKRVAEMTYSRAYDGTLVIIDHTEVDPSLRGQGIPTKLVAAAVQWARAEKIRVVPLCPFAKAVIDRTTEFQDVLQTPR